MRDIERELLNIIQRDFPIERRPFAVIGERLGIAEQECLALLRDLIDRGILREIRPVVAWSSAGFSGVLIGLEVASDRVDDVASAVNEIPGVTHNYLREGRFNLWCTLTYDTPEQKLRHISFMRSLDGVVDVREFASEKTYKIGLVLDV